ncbi:MAG: GlsB/YeaQ/YmgE family stress response membrane protein [Parachlamydiaceae bacterium]|nr:GlsB/YeaQ/YmgE family stress response membrane protein [Parachlamydiaceae bacterium]
MSLLFTVLMGFLIGLFARALMPGKDVAGFIMTTLLGIGGALVGKFLGQSLGLYQEGEPAGFFMSLLGAIILLSIYHYFRKNSVRP